MSNIKTMSFLFARRRALLFIFLVFFVISIYFLPLTNDKSYTFSASKDEPLENIQQQNNPTNVAHENTVTEKVYVTVGADVAVTVVETHTATVVSTQLAVSTVYVDSVAKAPAALGKSPFLGEDIQPKNHPLDQTAFNTENQLHHHSGRNGNRMVSNEAWRLPSEFPNDFYLTNNLRPQQPDLSYYEDKSQYMRQPIIANYAKHSEKMFLMMKTGATVMWNRLPIHFLTTFTRVPYFAIYSDMPASMGGYEIIDILANTTEDTKNTGAYRHYTTLQKFFHEGANADPAEGVDGHDGWSLDRHKNIPMLAHGYRTAPESVEWFFFLDGDTFMFMDNLMDYLNTLDCTEPIYLGCSHWVYGQRFAHGGSGVVLSRAALDITLGAHPEWEWELEGWTSTVCCGDYMVAKMMERVNVTVSHSDMHNIGRKFNDEHHWSLYAAPENWCEKVLGFHHVRPYEVELLWEYERSLGPERRKNILYADIYRDFTAPYIGEWMEEWDSLACEVEYCKKWEEEEAEKEAEKERLRNEETRREENKKGEDTKNEKRDYVKQYESEKPRPWWSAKHCEQACKEKKDCLNWRYLPNNNYCGLGTAVRLGRATHLGPLAYDELQAKLDHEHATSGYMIDRIREMRSKQECDVLYKGKNSQGSDPDTFEGEDRREGWMLSKKMSKDKSKQNSMVELLSPEELEKNKSH